MLFQAHTLSHLRGRLAEPVVFDHFETFEFTQDYPFGVGTSVGARSWFVYGLDPAPHGRGGRRSPAQQRRLRSRPKRETHGRYLGSARRMLDLLLELRRPDRGLELRSDAHPDYRTAARTHQLRRFLHIRPYANPTRGPRGTPRAPGALARDRAMYPVDLLHKIFRHSLAHHRRQTIAFPRRINAAMERLFLTAVWRNFIKKLSERKRSSPAPAMLLRLTNRRWTWKRLLSRRLFFDRTHLPHPWGQLYRREWVTPLLRSNATHEPARAF